MSKDQKTILILGGGTGGTVMAHRLSRALDHKHWRVAVLDHGADHLYQPGLLLVPFGVYTLSDITRKRRFRRGIDWIAEEAVAIESEKNRVRLRNGGNVGYDILIIATGCETRPQETAGSLGSLWGKSIFDFYTPAGSAGLAPALADFAGGDLVVHIAEMPIKCPVAPLEFAFLTDAYLRKRGIRSKTKLTFVTPLSGAFTKPIASGMLGELMHRKDIAVVPEFNIERIDEEKKSIFSYDGTGIRFDLLVTVPPNMGSRVIEASGFGDEMHFVPTDHKTLQSKIAPNIFALGDATDLPSSKAGAVAHFQADILTRNILDFIHDRPCSAAFEGHSNCFIESGHGKGIMIDFNYRTEPLPGKFPLPLVGPFSLLKETRINHWGKLLFRHLYWNLLLKGRSIPFVKSAMSMRGKIPPRGREEWQTQH